MTNEERIQLRTLQNNIVALAKRQGMHDSSPIGDFADNTGRLITVGDIKNYLYPQWTRSFEDILNQV